MADYGSLFRYDISTKGLLVGALAVIIVAWISPIVRSWIQKRKRLIDLAAKLPGPKCLPLIGNALQFACKPEELFDRMVEAIHPYEDVTPMRFWLGPILHVVVTEPRDIGIILNSPKSTVRGLVYRLIQPFIGDGLISGSGPSWRAHRKLFAPLFNGRTLEGFADVFQKHIKILVEKLKPLADRVEFNFGPYLNRCTIDATCETVMGCRDFNAQDNPDQDFPHATDRLYEIIHNRMLKVWYHPDWIFRLSPSYREQVKCQRVIHSFTEKLITAKQEEFSALLKGETVSCEGDRNSILEQLIEQMDQDKSILNHEELRDEIYTIYLATQDPTALIGNFTLLMLGIHKDVQDNVRSELNRVMQEDAEDIPPSLLPQLKYLEMVIKETLRLFPVAPYLVRALRDDLALETCVLPKGCQVLLPFYITHRSSRHWKNPDKFIPERFTPEEIALRHPYIYVPFSNGLMGCIGQKFAMISLKLIVASVVRSYRITSTTKMEEIKLKSDISIRSVNGFKLSLEPLGS